LVFLNRIILNDEVISGYLVRCISHQRLRSNPVEPDSLKRLNGFL